VLEFLNSKGGERGRELVRRAMENLEQRARKREQAAEM
jgi:hypothetical protein